MRSKTIDGIKAIAIVAVVLYHLGILRYGYLGVDIFFVISGFLTVKSFQNKKDKSITPFLVGRIKRILPAVLIAGFVCLLIGFCGMLPDDYENISEQVVASNFLSENVLSAITTKNYWDVSNDYKPLMHMWYIGVLVEFYVLFSITMKILRNEKKKKIGFLFLTFVSLVLYLIPIGSSSDKFYFIHYRFFEFGLGALFCLYAISFRNKHVFYLSTILVLFCLSFPFSFLPDQVRLIMVAFLSSVAIVSFEENEMIIGNRVLSCIGKRSFSVFIWHQIVFAFFRYYYTNRFSVGICLLLISIVVLLSALSYHFIEVKLGGFSTKQITVFIVVLFAVSTGLAGFVYMKAGVVRDVPELDIEFNNVHRGMHAEYNDRIYAYDKPFEYNGNYRVLVIGNSFARDWANILLESNVPIDLAYSFDFSDDIIPRINEAEFIFIKTNYTDIPDYVFDSKAKKYGIGTKNFGESNGIIYKNRGKEYYFEQTVKINDAYFTGNEEQKRYWGEANYIDLISPVTTSEGEIRVFTDDNKFISQDCTHLTQAGAKYYSLLLDIRGLFCENESENQLR